MDIKVIYDEAKAIREKAETDAHNRRLRRSVKILAIITLCVILLAITTNFLSKANLIHSVYYSLSVVIAIFFVIALWLLWGAGVGKEKEYSVNLQYYLAIKDNQIKTCRVESSPIITTRTFTSWGPVLRITAENQNHKKKFYEIEITSGIVTKGIDQDIIDFTKEDECGFWYTPDDRKAKELESRVVDTDEDD